MILVALVVLTTGLAGCLADEPASAAPSDPAEPETGPSLTPRYVNTGESGPEPNIGVTSTGTIFVTAANEVLRSRDRGASWEIVYDYQMLDPVPTGIGTQDPSLWVDPTTERVWVSHLYLEEHPLGPRDVTAGCFNIAWSDDEGDSWIQRDGACVTPRVDHQKIVAGPPGPEPNPFVDTAAHPSVAYMCYNDRLRTEADQPSQTSCIMSYDGGFTFPLKTEALDGASGCGGAAGHPAIAPDGTIVVPASYHCGPEVAVSRDSGLTWTVRAVPPGAGATDSLDPDVAFDADGTLYMIWRDGDHWTQLARSDDLGETWVGPWNVTAPGLTSTRFHVLSAGDDGRVAMAYLGTEMPRGTTWTDADGEQQSWVGAPSDAPPEALWHLYVVMLEDDGSEEPVLTSRQMTPDADPVQKGCVSLDGQGERHCRNLFDFIDSSVAPDGTFYVSYSDGCTARNECAGRVNGVDELDARDTEAAVAWLEGWSLLEG